MKRISRTGAGLTALAAAAALAVVGVSTGASADSASTLQQSGHVQCTTDAVGKCTITHTLGVTPTGIVLTPWVPDSQTSYMLSVVSGTPSPTSFVIKARTATSTPAANRVIAVGFVVTAEPAAPPVTTTTTTTTQAPPPSAYPNAANTGVPAGTNLTVVNGNYTASANEVISGKRITGNLTIAGNGVQVKNSEVYGIINNGSGHYSFSVTDTTVGPTSGCNGDAALRFDNYTATRVEVRNFGDAFRASTLNGVSNVLIQDSFAKLCSNPGDHADGYQGYQAGSNVKLLHNTIDMEDAAPDVTAPIFSADDSRALVATDNLLSGGSYTVRIYDRAGENSTFTNNKVVEGSAMFGAVDSSCSSITWTGNSLVHIDANYNITETVGPLACAG